VYFPHIDLIGNLRCLLIAALLVPFGAAQTAQPSLVNHLYRIQLSTGEVVSSTWHGAQVDAATSISDRGARWTLIGASEPDRNGSKKLIYSDNSSGALSLSVYGRTGALLSSASLMPVGAGWKSRAVADIDGDGNLDVIATQATSGQVAVHFYGGQQGTRLLRTEVIDSLSSTGWNVIGAADLNGDGHPDLLLQDASSREVMVAYLSGSNGIAVTATQILNGHDFHGWTAAGMLDMNGDGHPDLILGEDATGKTIVNYYGGELGVNYLGTEPVDESASADWKFVVPSGPTTTESSSTDLVASTSTPVTSDSIASVDTQVSTLASVATATSTTPTTTSTTTTWTSTTSAPVLIFNGTGTSSTAVSAIENVVHNLGIAYHTVNSSQLDSLTQSKLATYRLFIVPGGNSITIGKYLTSKATTTVRSAISQNGLNYLGMCAGGFFGGYSSYYKVLNLTSGVWFKFFADYYKGIHKESVLISFPSRSKLDIYWQNGPSLTGWGKVVGRYPNGTAAITEGYWGKGFVILSGVHPEAPKSWRTGMSFSTPVDVDLAYAATLVRAAMNRTMLPHY
jgi:hypothetical protein